MHLACGHLWLSAVDAQWPELFAFGYFVVFE